MRQNEKACIGCPHRPTSTPSTIKDGTIPSTECICTEVPYVRFRKQLSLGISKNTEKKLDTREELIQAKKRTVFIINSENLKNFLLQFEVDPLIIEEVC